MQFSGDWGYMLGLDFPTDGLLIEIKTDFPVVGVLIICG
jgi:hypothetical protein